LRADAVTASHGSPRWRPPAVTASTDTPPGQRPGGDAPAARRAAAPPFVRPWRRVRSPSDAAIGFRWPGSRRAGPNAVLGLHLRAFSPVAGPSTRRPTSARLVHFCALPVPVGRPRSARTAQMILAPHGSTSGPVRKGGRQIADRHATGVHPAPFLSRSLSAARVARLASMASGVRAAAASTRRRARSSCSSSRRRGARRGRDRRPHRPRAGDVKGRARRPGRSGLLTASAMLQRRPTEGRLVRPARSRATDAAACLLLARARA
jgi:hypothetical protein